jgi:hypothetical protein
MRKALMALVAMSMLVLAGPAVAGKVGHAKLWVYDPGNTGNAAAEWTKDGLSLQKNAATSVELAAGAEIRGVAGETLSQLSFDVKGYCGAGAPRFNVTTESGTAFFGCSYGETEDLGDGWTRVTFSGDEIGGAGAFGSVITGVDVVMDEQGQTLLRNLSVNGMVINKY